MPRAKKQTADERRLAFLADRTAILLTVAKMRYGNDWNPFFTEGLYEDEGSLGDEIRGWPEYKDAKAIIRRWIERDDERSTADGKDVTDTADAARTAQA